MVSNELESSDSWLSIISDLSSEIFSFDWQEKDWIAAHFVNFFVESRPLVISTSAVLASIDDRCDDPWYKRCQ